MSGPLIVREGGTPIVRAEGISELVADLVLNCKGGTPTPAGAPMPLANFQVFLNANVTSRLIGPSALSEATLLIDEPSPSNQVLCTRDGALCREAKPNVFSGVATASGIPGAPVPDSIIWRNVPFDPPGEGPTRVIRITNVRVNASQKQQIVMIVTVTCTQPLIVTNAEQVVANVQPGLVAGATTTRLSQCAHNVGSRPVFDFNVTVTEGFATAFKRRNIGLTPDGSLAAPLYAQNVPNFAYQTESGFYAPNLFNTTPPVGLANFGTRIRITFGPVGPETRISVPVNITLTAGGATSFPPQPLPPVPLGIPTAQLRLVDPTPLPPSAFIDNTPVAEATHLGTMAYAVYEVVNSDPAKIETATIPVSVAFGPPNQLPAPGDVKVSVSLVPADDVTAMLVPRFQENTASLLAYTIYPCVPFTCDATASVPIVRAEGITELVGDVVLTCTGGTPTPAGDPIPLSDVRVTLDTNVTSRMLAGPPNLVEAVLMIGDPPPDTQMLCDSRNGCLVKGTGGVPSPYLTQPNIFLGKQIGMTTVTWLVPIDPPGLGATRVIRIKNVRANASQAVGSGQIMMAVAVTPGGNAQPVELTGPGVDPRLTVASISPGMVLSGTSTVLCTSHNVPLSGFDFTITVKEGFQGAFQRRAIGLTANGSTAPTAYAQNVPNFLYHTESGFYGPDLSPLGPADFGTRIRVSFGPVGPETRISVPVSITLTAGGATSFPPQPPPSVPPGIRTAQLRLVQTNPSGVSPSPPGFLAVPRSASIENTDVAEATHFGTMAYAVYEVVNSDPVNIETATIPVSVAFGPTNLPAPGDVKVSVSLVPVDDGTTPVPRFQEGTASQLAYSLSCVPLTCVASVPVTAPPTVRAEGITELVGDLILKCTGGTPTPTGGRIPFLEVQVTLNVDITSRMLTGPPNLVEAVLMIDDPNAGMDAVPDNTEIAAGSPPQILCKPQGSLCQEIGTFTGKPSPSPYQTQPNVFLGRRSGTNSVAWSVPIDPPGPGNTRTVRITNVRANASQAVGSRQIVMTVTVVTVTPGDDAQPVKIDGSSQTVASVSPGLVTSGNSAMLSLCTSHNVPLSAFDFTITVKEGFKGAFQRRNIGLTSVGSTAPVYAQNVPGFSYQTESGFYAPNLFGSTSTPTTVGLADFGTRIRLTFNNVGAGVRIYLPVSVALNSTPPQPPSPVPAGIKTGLLRLIDPGGPTSLISAGPEAVAVVQVISQDSTATAVYEVMNSDPMMVEMAAIRVAVSFPAPNQPAPQPGEVTVSVSFTPDGVDITPPELPVPRFTKSSRSQFAYSIASCPPLTCVASVPVLPLVRAEGITELVGDLLLNCTGGTPTPAGQPIPLVTVQISVNTNVTSRLLDSGLSEATLIILETGQVLRGRPMGPRSIAWMAPIDPPGQTAPPRVIRITNVRANACKLVPPDIVMSVAVNPESGAQQVPVQDSMQRVAFVRPGLVVVNVTGANLLRCQRTPAGDGGKMSITIREGFGAAFKARGTVPPACAPDVPATGCGSETGFYAPALADHGTRIRITFNNVGNGTHIFLPVTVPLSSDVPPAPPSGRLILVQTDFAGNSAPGFTAVTGTAIKNGVSAAEIGHQGDTAYAVYEVLSSDPSSVESATIPVAVEFSANELADRVTVNVALAPTGGPQAGIQTADATAPIPRFCDKSTPMNLFSINDCSCTLLFPFVTNVNGIDTAMTIANTSLDPFGTPAQSGKLTLYYYGGVATADPPPSPQTTAGIVPAGCELVFTLMNGGGVGNCAALRQGNAAADHHPMMLDPGTSPPTIPATPGFHGYIIAVAEFQYCHGLAVFSSLTFSKHPDGYLAIQLDNRGLDRTGMVGENKGH